MEPTDDITPTQSAGAAATTEPGGFPRIQLPPPPFASAEPMPAREIETPAPAAPNDADPVVPQQPVGREERADGEVRRGYDEPPAQQWASPFPQPMTPEQQYRAMVAARSVAPPSAAQPFVAPMVPAQHGVVDPPVHAPVQPQAAASVPSQTAPAASVAEAAPAPAPSRIPAMTPTQTTSDDAATDSAAQARSSRVAPLLVLACAAVLWYLSGTSMSSALLAYAALLVAQVAAAFAAAAATIPSRVVAAVAAAAVVLALVRGAGQFSDMALVMGLLIFIAAVPMLLLLGVAQLLLRRRGERASPFDRSLREGFTPRALAFALLIGAGYHAHTTFTGTVDGIATFAIAALAALTLVRALRPAAAGASS